jgi:tRNA(fMet)-specific endonuclease VapC
VYLLDTDTLTHLYSGNSNVTNRLKSVTDVEVGITIVTKVEILRGRIDYLLKADNGSNLLKAQELFFRTERLLGELLIVPMNGRADLLISSITLAHRATLVTRNLRHFKQIPGLRLENWVD